MKKSKSQNPSQETPMKPPEVTLKYPYQNNCEHFIVGWGDYILPNDAGSLFEKTIGLPANKSKLKAFLIQKCNIVNPTDYSFPDIMGALRVYVISNYNETAIVKSQNLTEILSAETNIPLSKKAFAVLKLLKELEPHKALTGTQILDKLAESEMNFDQSTLTKKIIPELKPFGVKNKPRIGYYIETTG